MTAALVKKLTQHESGELLRLQPVFRTKRTHFSKLCMLFVRD